MLPSHPAQTSPELLPLLPVVVSPFLGAHPPWRLELEQLLALSQAQKLGQLREIKEFPFLLMAVPGNRWERKANSFCFSSRSRADAVKLEKYNGTIIVLLGC